MRGLPRNHRFGTLRAVAGAALVASLVAPVASSPVTEAGVPKPALVTLPPARLADTRPGATTVDGLLQGEGQRAAMTEYEVQVAGRGGVPVGAAGAIVNVAAVSPAGWGFLTVHPCVSDRPETSAVNYTTGVTVSNEVISALSADGSLCVYTFAATHLLVDVVGYLPASDALVPIVPARVHETREGAPTVDGLSQGTGRTVAGSTSRIRVAGRGGVPTGVDGVVVNVGAVDPTDTGFVEVDPCTPGPKTTSAINYVPGVDRANEVITPVDANGDICIFTQHGLELIVDVVAFVPTGTNYRSVTSKRYLETRPGAPTFDGADQGEGKRAAGSEYRLEIGGRGDVPADAAAAVVNVTGVEPDDVGFLTVHPCLANRPNASSLNYVAGVNGANELVVGLNGSGEICIFTFQPIHLLVDVVGYLMPGTAKATDDSYKTVGNTVLEVGQPAGAAPAVRVTGSILANDTGAGPLTLVSADTASALGGSVAVDPDGTFTYIPPVGATGVTDTFSYTIDDGGPAPDTGTVSIELSDLVWYVDNTSVATTKTGRSNAPFATLAAAQAAGGTGHTIFVDAGDGTDTGYDQGIELMDGQKLIGEATGLTVGGTVLVPPGPRPIISASGGADTVTLGSGSSASGLQLNITGTGAAVVSTGAGGTVTDVDITANSEGIRLDNTTGAFTFDNVDVTSSGGTSFHVNGGSANITFSRGTITQTGNAAGIDIASHTGTFTFASTSTANITNGTGLQFDDADGTYMFDGTTTLNGGDAGIDILNGSAGTFTFPSTTTITNPTGPAVKIDDFAAPGDFDFDGSIVANLEVILQAFVSEAGTSIDFNTTGSNSLMSTGSPFGAIELFELDGNLTMTTPTTVTDPDFSALFATDGGGTWSFTDLTVVDLKDLNGGVDVFGNTGTVNFHNVNVSTDSAGTGDAATGFLAGGNNIINVTGNSSVDADGGGAVVLVDINQIGITFQSLTSTNNTSTQIGFAGDDGIDLLSIGTGTFTVTGTTTVTNADGQGISVEDVGADVTFETLALDDIGKDGVISGVAFDNPGTITINGGTINDTGDDGIRLGSGGSGNGAASVAVNGVTFTSIGGVVANVSNSVLAGSGNTAVPFSCTDLGGNTGSIAFNATDTCP